MTFGKLGARGGFGSLGVLGTVQAYNQLISTLKSSTVWAKLSALYVFAVPTQAAAVQNLISPGTLDLTATNSPTFTPNMGFTGDGISMNLLGPTFSSISAVGFSQNNAAAGVYSISTQQTSGLGGIMGTDTSVQPFGFNSADTNGSAIMRGTSTTSDTFPAANFGINHIAFSRSVSGSYAAFVDQMKTVQATVSGAVPTTAKLTFLRVSTTYTLNKVAAGWIGVALTDAEYATLDAALTTYLRRVGAYSQNRGFDGAWTWFNDPRAIYIGSSLPVVGSLTINGSAVVGQPANNLFTRSVLHNLIGLDDHSNPALLIRASDSKIIAHYSTHNAAGTNYFQRISTNANDPTSFAAEVNIGSQFVGASSIFGFSYANLFQLSGESNKLYSFFRANTSATAGDLTIYYSTSADGGTTWAQAQVLLWAGRPYFKGVQNGTARIDCLVSSGNPGDGYFNYCNIYHFYYQGGKFYTSAGVDMGLPPYAQTQPTKIYDSQASGFFAWNWDIVPDGGGSPVACFAEFRTTSDHRYYQARLSAGVWSYNQVCAAGGGLYPNATDANEPYYSGGIITDPTDQNTVFCSRQVDSSGNVDPVNGIFQLFKYTSSDGGVTWAGTQLTFGSLYCFRPYIPVGSRTLCYVTGTYTSYTSYQTNIAQMAI